MRRIIIIGTALAVLAGATAAYAALNSYTATIKFNGGKGSPKHPAPVGFVETLGAANTIAGDRAAPLVDIKTSIYGLVPNSAAFKNLTCNGPEMSVQKGDGFCPPKALVATGPVTSVLGNNVLSTTGSACDPFLHVWNGGGGKLWFFFTTDATHVCAGGALHTGDTAAYPGFIKVQGKYMVTDVPLPPDVSYKVANHANLYGSLIKEVLTFKNLTVKYKGKTVGFQSSIGCLNGKRPYSVVFTAVLNNQRESKTVTGKAPC